MGRKLICILIAVVGMVLTAWFRPGAEMESAASFCPQITTPQATVQVLNKPQEVAFPCALEDSGLVAEYMRAYDGPFLEDGSNDPVEGVAALMVHNAGSRDISSAMVTVEQEGRKLHFFVTWLPAGSRVLVLEYGREAYKTGQITGCSVAGVRWETFWTEGIRMEESNDGGVLVTNAGGKTVRNIRLRHKLYVANEEYYLGGITYCSCVANLASGESWAVAPQGYGAADVWVVAVVAG